MSDTPRTPINPRIRPVVLAISAGIAVLGIALAAVLVTRSTDKTTVSASDSTVEVAKVRVSGAILSPMPEGDAVDPAVGTMAPSVSGQLFDGSGQSIKPGSGPLLLMFVAHWCPHCQREVPLVAKWADNTALAGVTLQAVSTGVKPDLPNYPPSAWLARENWTIPTLVDDEDTTAANAFGLTSFPYFVAIDATGKVVKRASGELTEAQFNELATLAGGGTPAA